MTPIFFLIREINTFSYCHGLNKYLLSKKWTKQIPTSYDSKIMFYIKDSFKKKCFT